MTSQPSSVEEANVRVVKALIDAYNAHDTNQYVQNMSDSIIAYSPGKPQGAKGLGPAITAMISDVTAIPDIRLNIDRIMGQGDEVSVRGTTTGTTSGYFVSPKGRRLKGSGKRVDLPQAYFFRLQGGKIVETHEYWDRLTVDRAFGLLRRNTLRILALTFIGLALMVADIVVGESLGVLPPFISLTAGALLSAGGVLWLGRTILALGKG